VVIRALLDSRAHLDRRERQERLAFPVDRDNEVDLVREYFGSVKYLTL